MNRSCKRLLLAGLGASCLHGTVLFWAVPNGRFMPMPAPVSTAAIAVSVGARSVVPQVSVDPKEQSGRDKDRLLSPFPEPKLSGAKPMASPQKPQSVAPRAMGAPVKETKVPSEVQGIMSGGKAVLSGDRGQTIEDDGSHVTIKATPLYQVNPSPRYPRLAQRRGLEGTVVLEVLVDLTGGVSELKISSSSGSGILDKAALRTVRSWQFTVGSLDGAPQPMWVKVPVCFQLL